MLIKIYDVIKLLCIHILATFLFSLLKVALEAFDLHDFNPPLINDSLKSEFPVAFILLTILIVPVIEELSFRLFLKPNNTNVELGIAAFVSILFIFFIDMRAHLLFLPIYLRVSFAYVILLVTFYTFIKFFFLNYSRIKARSISFLKSNFSLILFNIIFAAMHYKSELGTAYIWLYPVTLGSYFVGGYIYSILRIRHGLKYGILCHSMYNSILLGSSFLFEV
ncbi:type II CAAX prenyl endopeptidase Rce1 family protein [Fulvivirga lutea]|uniref:CPBP family intramembrane metalloprotease n=1 Tax=Fulvivirga lutea TaxID=2810512 RepID=A0A974WG33_9BACT|nr:CPBP family glutamic-type intramembrane protease [Fulvivirga lutea]QSE97828.1 CPBP family intramembrane metalloprotease [Fulvivirga lutea]